MDITDQEMSENNFQFYKEKLQSAVKQCYKRKKREKETIIRIYSKMYETV